MVGCSLSCENSTLPQLRWWETTVECGFALCYIAQAVLVIDLVFSMPWDPPPALQSSTGLPWILPPELCGLAGGRAGIHLQKHWEPGGGDPSEEVWQVRFLGPTQDLTEDGQHRHLLRYLRILSFFFLVNVCYSHTYRSRSRLAVSRGYGERNEE